MKVKFTNYCRLDVNHYFEKDKEYKISDSMAKRVIALKCAVDQDAKETEEIKDEDMKTEDKEEPKTEEKAVETYENKAFEVAENKEQSKKHKNNKKGKKNKK